MSDPAALVQRQLDAYNARDIDAWLATYAPDAEQRLLHGERIAKGHEEIRQHMAGRFADANLHARLLSRVVAGSVVVDHELITRNFPEGRGSVELLCIYEVVDGLISKALFSFGQPKID